MEFTNRSLRCYRKIECRKRNESFCVLAQFRIKCNVDLNCLVDACEQDMEGIIEVMKTTGASRICSILPDRERAESLLLKSAPYGEIYYFNWI